MAEIFPPSHPGRFSRFSARLPRRKATVQHGRYSHLKAFFNFIGTNLDPTIQNPCDAQMLRRRYRPRKPILWDAVEQETIDEIIFRMTKVRNRLILVDRLRTYIKDKSWIENLYGI
jgi:hypothetical protein